VVHSGDWKYVWDTGKEELHNLADDPGESNDLLSQRPEIVTDLKKKLSAWEADVQGRRLREFSS